MKKLTLLLTLALSLIRTAVQATEVKQTQHSIEAKQKAIDYLKIPMTWETFTNNTPEVGATQTPEVSFDQGIWGTYKPVMPIVGGGLAGELLAYFARRHLAKRKHQALYQEEKTAAAGLGILGAVAAMSKWGAPFIGKMRKNAWQKALDSATQLESLEKGSTAYKAEEALFKKHLRKFKLLDALIFHGRNVGAGFGVGLLGVGLGNTFRKHRFLRKKYHEKPQHKEGLVAHPATSYWNFRKEYRSGHAPDDSWGYRFGDRLTGVTRYTPDTGQPKDDE